MYNAREYAHVVRIGYLIRAPENGQPQRMIRSLKRSNSLLKTGTILNIITAVALPIFQKRGQFTVYTL